jgi:large subunit ribosomal protein L9
MPMHLQVILQTDVDKLGKSGELVRVRPGYARNFLIPRAFAVPASESAVNRLKHEKAVALAKYEKQKKEYAELAKKIGAVTIKMARTVGDEDRLFGTVTTKEIEAAAKAQGLDIDRKKMNLAEPIKALGTYEIAIKLMTEVTATLKVEVVKK